MNKVCGISVWLTPPEVDENAMERHATTHATNTPWRKPLVVMIWFDYKQTEDTGEVGKIASTPTYSQYEQRKIAVQDIKW